MKPVPYFPLYAANILASKPFKMMTIEERGLWITIQMECWVNGSVPSDLKDLAKYLGVGHDEVQRSFTQKQYSFIQKVGSELKSPDLEVQRKEFMDRREKQRIGGMQGAENKRQKQAKVQAMQGQPQGVPAGQPKGSLDYVNSDSFKSSQLVRSEITDAENKAWVDEYENTPDFSNSYLKASKG
jgi:hypothetical protein